MLLNGVQDEAETVLDESNTRETPADTALLDQLRSENAYLRGELTAAREQLTEERRRADTLIASLMGRLPELAPVQPTATSGGLTSATPATSPSSAPEPTRAGRDGDRDAGDIDN